MTSSTAILGDTNKVMKGYSDREFTLSLSDPPYFKGLGRMGYWGDKVNKNSGVKRGNYGVPDWDNNLPDAAFYQQLKRTSENFILWGANYYDFIGPVHKTPVPNTLQSWMAEHPVGWIVWDKVTGNGVLKNYELAFTSFDRPTVVIPFMWNGMCQGKSLSEPYTMQGNKKLNEKRIHPTQKPVVLYKWMLHNYASPGDKIFDSHLGSGSSRIAAYDMGFDFTGVEISATNYKAQERRFKHHSAKLQFQF